MKTTLNSLFIKVKESRMITENYFSRNIKGILFKKLSFVVFFSAFILLNNTKCFSQIVSCGDNHSLFICNNGIPMAWGSNGSGQLGTGSNATSPVQINSLSGITAISGGFNHSLFLKNDGTVWACGANTTGQFGDGTTISKSFPAQSPFLFGIVAIAAGYGHSLFLKNDSTVWASGSNNVGQLGDGTTTNKSVPVKINSLSEIIAIAAGKSTPANHSLFLKNDGTVWACGGNTYGKLGDGTNVNRNSPVQVSSLSGIIAIAAGINHSLFLKNDGTVWACGDNSYGQSGNGTNHTTTPVQIPTLSGIVAIAAGYLHSLFLKNDGTVWACGLNNCGQLGDGTTINRYTPVQIPSLSGIVAIAAGHHHSLFLKNDGTLWASGCNNSGKLGDGTTTNKTTPVQVTGLCTVVTNIEDENLSSENNISLYPNPFTTQTTLRSDKNLNNASIYIYNALGQMVKQVNNISGHNFTLYDDNLTIGIYHFQLIEDNKIIKTEKLVVSE
jgi:alpha-tubulin suppressor-like RCC1 family protein